MISFPETPEEPAEEKGQEAASDFILFDMRTLTHFREEGPAVLVLSDTGAARMVLFALRAGQHVEGSSHLQPDSDSDTAWSYYVYCGRS